MAIFTKSGERRIWKYQNTLRAEGVSAPLVRGMAHDVTEQVKAQKALREVPLSSGLGKFHRSDRVRVRY